MNNGLCPHIFVPFYSPTCALVLIFLAETAIRPERWSYFPIYGRGRICDDAPYNKNNLKDQFGSVIIICYCYDTKYYSKINNNKIITIVTLVANIEILF